MDLKELENGLDPEIHWYYQTKKIPLFRYFKKVQRKIGGKVNLIDVGSGSGFFPLALLKRFGDKVGDIYLVDIGYSQEELEATKDQQVKKVHRVPEDMENCLIILMDILEHLEDDLAMLQEIKQRCKARNYFFITVPAFMSLWSGHDVFLEHYRRYTRSQMTKVVRAANYTIRSSYYLYGSIFPLVWVVRQLTKRKHEQRSDMQPAHPVVNGLLKAWNGLEMNWRRLNKLFGVSVCVEGVVE